MARDWYDLFLVNGGAPQRPPEPDREEGRRGFFRRLRENMRKTREALSAEVQATLFENLDDETWERLEEALIYADVGAPTSRRRGFSNSMAWTSADSASRVLRMFSRGRAEESRPVPRARGLRRASGRGPPAGRGRTQSRAIRRAPPNPPDGALSPDAGPDADPAAADTPHAPDAADAPQAGEVADPPTTERLNATPAEPTIAVLPTISCWPRRRCRRRRRWCRRRRCRPRRPSG